MKFRNTWQLATWLGLGLTASTQGDPLVPPPMPSILTTAPISVPPMSGSPTTTGGRPVSSQLLPPPLPTLFPTTQPTTGPTSAPAAASVPTQTQTTAPSATEPVGPPGAENPSDVVVTADLDRERVNIAPSLGAVTYTIGPSQIQAIPGGENASFQQVLLRSPGVVEDSFGQVHVRGEHSDLTYRVNGVLLPASIASLGGFGQEVDTRVVDSVTLIDGSLPAQFGFRTAGIVDVTTKTGATLDHNELSIYGGSYNIVEPGFLVGGTTGKFDYFVSGSFRQSGLGIENPASTATPLHDWSDGGKAFGYMAWKLDDTSRLSVVINGSDASFQIPNLPGKPALFSLAGVNSANSANINETQDEQDYYTAVSYQKTMDRFSFLAAVYSRYGAIHFNPDDTNDLVFSGVASAISNNFLTNGLQIDASYTLDDQHTVRFGLLGDYTSEILNSNNLVFPVDSTGAQTSTTPFAIIDKGGNWGADSGLYIQDEWKLAEHLTLNYGARYDRFDASWDQESQISPRANIVWRLSKALTVHAGYSRYFAPPPVQYVWPFTVARFAGTSNAPANLTDFPTRAERSNYYDIGMSKQITPDWQITLDAYYKGAKPLLDSGQFGNAIILAPFNYAQGRDYGAEFSTNYKVGGWSLYTNFAWISATGMAITSGQYQFANDELAYITRNSIHLDHESEYTLSAGASYQWKANRVYADILYGSGLRAGFANTQKEPDYYPVDVGFEHVFHPEISGVKALRFRFDVVNVFDQVYQLRNGTGVGVGAPQYGQRRGFYSGLTFEF